MTGQTPRPLVELLYFDGCPNYEGAQAMVERVSREFGLDLELRLVNVPDQRTARRLRFLGSPTIRIDGRDIDQTAADRDEYVLSCRVYRTEDGFTGQPDERWLRARCSPRARPKPAKNSNRNEGTRLLTTNAVGIRRQDRGGAGGCEAVGCLGRVVGADRTALAEGRAALSLSGSEAAA